MFFPHSELARSGDLHVIMPYLSDGTHRVETQVFGRSQRQRIQQVAIPIIEALGKQDGSNSASDEVNLCIALELYKKRPRQYDHLIRECLQENNLAKALSLHEEAVKSDIQPAQLTYDDLIDACLKNHNLQKALSLFLAMQKFGMQPTATINERLKSACAASQKLAYEHSLFETKNLTHPTS